MGKNSVFFKQLATESLITLPGVYGQHKFDLFVCLFVEGSKGLRVDLGGLGSVCDKGVIYEIPK